MLFLLKLTGYILVTIVLLLFCSFVFTRWQAGKLAERYPNVGTLTEIAGVRINSVHNPRPVTADLLPIVFIHGASGNLRDPMGAFLEPLKDRAELLFVDRPGHGYSERGGEANMTPAGQADAIAALMRAKGISRAIIVGHSFGGAITASFALRHKEMVAGLLFLSPATHPWPGGVDWYYDAANIPLLGTLLCNTITLPAGLLQMETGVRHVFQPNPVPAGYLEKAAIPMVLRPASFCANARDVANLLAYVSRIQPRYREITAPTVIITGDSDDIVYEELHSRGLKRDLPNSEIYWVHGLGHKPDYVATDLAIGAIEKLAGRPVDLPALVRTVESRIGR